MAVILLKQFPIVKPRYGIEQAMLDRINALIDEETKLYAEPDSRLVVWDSAMGLVSR